MLTQVHSSQDIRAYPDDHARPKTKTAFQHTFAEAPRRRHVDARDGGGLPRASIGEISVWIVEDTRAGDGRSHTRTFVLWVLAITIHNHACTRIGHELHAYEQSYDSSSRHPRLYVVSTISLLYRV